MGTPREGGWPGGLKVSFTVVITCSDNGLKSPPHSGLVWRLPLCHPMRCLLPALSSSLDFPERTKRNCYANSPGSAATSSNLPRKGGKIFKESYFSIATTSFKNHARETARGFLSGRSPLSLSLAAFPLSSQASEPSIRQQNHPVTWSGLPQTKDLASATVTKVHC